MSSKKLEVVDDRAPGFYVRRVQEDTRRYLAHLREENDTLRTLVTSLDAESTSLREPLARAEKLLRANDEVAAQITRSEAELHRLDELLVRMREDMRKGAVERAELRQQLNEVREHKEQFTEQYSLLEHRNNNLANLYVASYSLHGSLDQNDVLQAMKEIVINLVGSEDFVIYRADGESLVPVASFDDGAGLDALSLGQGVIGESVATGARVVCMADDTPVAVENGRDMVACIPLRVGSRPVGAIVLHKLLAHKAGLTMLDLELFDLLATQAATALFASSLAAQEPGGQKVESA